MPEIAREFWSMSHEPVHCNRIQISCTMIRLQKSELLGAWHGDPHLLCDVEAVWMSTLKAEVLGLNA